VGFATGGRDGSLRVVGVPDMMPLYFLVLRFFDAGFTLATNRLSDRWLRHVGVNHELVGFDLRGRHLNGLTSFQILGAQTGAFAR